MFRTIFLAAIIAALGCLLASGVAAASDFKVGPPPGGKLYHGVFPGGTTGEEDDITPAEVDAYEAVVGKQVAWVYFSHNWYRSRQFPLATATWIRARGAVPYIRLMLRADASSSRPRQPYRLANILRGDIDADLRQWARDARDFGSPLLVEFGTECNGNWFPWNAQWNGGGGTRRFGDPAVADGAERFVTVFRLIVTIAREEGARNITWVFHPNSGDWPERDWNRLEEYYPGDEFVDWVAISAYGPQTPLDDYLDSFRDQVDPTYSRLQAIAPAKPVIIAEFGVTAGNPLIAPEDWAGPALDDLLAFRWPNVIGFSWWNERWENDNNPAHDTTMRVQDTPALGQTFNTKLAAASAILQLNPVSVPAPTPAPTPVPVPLAACPPAPLPGCNAPARSQLYMKATGDGSGDRLNFDFHDGTTPQVWDDLGNPIAATNYLLCLYTGNSLAASAQVLPDSMKWSARPRGKGYKYTDVDGITDGIVKLKLRAGGRGTPKPPDLRLRGKGTNLPALPLPVPAPINVAFQIIKATDGGCWGDSYTSAIVNKDGETKVFRARR